MTGKFGTPFTVTGNETEDITVIMSLSTNNSFEWEDDDANDIFNIPEDTVVDMGLRGLAPYVE